MGNEPSVRCLQEIIILVMVSALKEKARNFLILILCFFYALIRGRATRHAVSKKIVILQMAKLGDMICTTPMFRAVKEKYPEAKLYVIGNGVNKEVVFGNPDIDEYLVLGKNDFWKTIAYLRKEKIDFACQTSPYFISLAMFFLAGIPQIAVPKIENGYSPLETRTYKLLRHLVISIPHKMGSYAPREYLRLLEPIGIQTERTQKYLYFSDQARKKIDDLFQENEIKSEDFLVCISPAAGNKIKEWPAERFSQVADYLYTKHKAKIFIIGAKNDRAEVLEMVNHLRKETKVINTLDELSIDELKALMSRMNLSISVDTGPIYIAEAFGVPTVDITGPIDQLEQPPIGPQHRVVFTKDRVKPELFVMNAKNYNFTEARRQVEVITVKMVTDEIGSLYNFLKNNEGKN